MSKSGITAYQYVAFLRGINVGGHKKVPMQLLKAEMKKLQFSQITTILNSGNIIFSSTGGNSEEIEEQLSTALKSFFGFSIPCVVRTAAEMEDLYNAEPFKKIQAIGNTRLYISFLKEKIKPKITFPWTNENDGFEILQFKNKHILSLLILSLTKSTEAMRILEDHFGKNLTTRNWNTVEKIIKKI